MRVLAAWVVVLATVGVGCEGGKGGGTLDRVCRRLCTCLEMSSSSGGSDPFDPVECVTDCKGSTSGSTPEEDAPSEACADCVDAASCNSLLGGAACDSACSSSGGGAS